ncbi:hypothetical protein RCO28_30800 [Streptomyces sp. LHD-70]|uniref:hypothetical protein n=1 Tax=Streptomyces sp. LHD-70 TaxID=3072140 RepID=UPI00280E4B7C|nr:hypothetical protein [Streptomyces sp. LHD-70]MDQ8706827.1 hypothetical protein [Streptomyces sp. LHD-70]
MTWGPTWRGSRRIPTAAAVCALLSAPLTACSPAGVAASCVPPKSKSVSASDLVGTFEGAKDADGAGIVLKEKPGEDGGTLSVHNWPTGEYYRDTLGATFDGTGTWEIQPASKTVKYPLLQLHFEEPKEFAPEDTVDMLSVAYDSKRTVIYEDADPDVCPKFRLELQGN